jgi:GT2 family glycosyltransferase
MNFKPMEEKTEIDVIILSYAHTHSLLQLTKSCLISLFQSENQRRIKFNIIVIESHKQMQPYQYPGTKTIYPEQPFGYHRYMNIGINASYSPYICICNNDLIFHPNWASAILKQMKLDIELVSASPIASNYHPNLGISLSEEAIPGYRVGYEIAGWCLFYKRDIIRKIGILDENYEFSGADYDYAYTLWVSNLKHALITSAVVDHIAAQTLKTQSKVRQYQLTDDIIYHRKKWGSRISDIPDPEPAN